MSAVRLDWLLLCANTVAEIEKAKSGGPSGSGTTTTTLPNGMHETRINYRELEAE